MISNITFNPYSFSNIYNTSKDVVNSASSINQNISVLDRYGLKDRSTKVVENLFVGSQVFFIASIAAKIFFPAIFHATLLTGCIVLPAYLLINLLVYPNEFFSNSEKHEAKSTPYKNYSYEILNKQNDKLLKESKSLQLKALASVAATCFGVMAIHFCASEDSKKELSLIVFGAGAFSTSYLCLKGLGLVFEGVASAIVVAPFAVFEETVRGVFKK